MERKINTVFRVKKILKMCVILLVILNSHSAFAQITVEAKNQPLKEILKLIEAKSEYRFFYNEGLKGLDKVTSLDVNNATIDRTMSDLLANSYIGYRIEKSHLIVLIAKPKPNENNTRNISGQVTAPNGEPLIGATVRDRNSNNGTVTDVQGQFTLDNVDDLSVLEFTYLGYSKATVKVNGQKTVSVVLEENSKMLAEVVKIGYGESSRRDLTGSIAKIAGSLIANRPNDNAMSSLQGKVPGLSVVNNGQMNQAPDVRIRGTVSLAQTSPLYIVDGIMSDNMSLISTSEIESVEVLKDPSSLAIFGVRGANGVIIVTTKKGKEGKLTVSFNSSVALKSIVDVPEMTDREGFIQLYNEQRANNSQLPYNKYDIYSANTNWVDAIKEPDPTLYKGNLSLSHGTDKNRFYLGLNYIQEKGLIRYERFKKIGISANNELNISKIFKCGFGVNGYAASLPQNHDFKDALKSPPIVSPYNPAQKQYNRLPEGLGGNDILNPLLKVEGQKYTSVASEYNFAPNIFFELSVLKKVTFRTNYYFHLYTKQQRDYTPISQVYNLESDAVETRNDKTAVYQFENLDLKFQQEYLITYKDDFKDHHITLLGGLTTYYQNYKQTSASVKQKGSGADLAIPDDERWWYVGVFPYGDPASYWAGSDQYERKTLSFLFRSLYNYNGKYLLNASFRRDGSSAISPSHRFQNFWALGGAWLLTEEKFMKSQRIFDNIKLKASVGQLGNQYTGNEYRYLYYPVYKSGTMVAFGNNVQNVLVLTYEPDKNLRWETITSYETGVETDLLKSHLHFEANLYQRETKDLLTTVKDESTGILQALNAGSVRVNGLELLASLNGKALNNKLNYSVSANVSTMNNKVLSVWKKGEHYSGGSIGQCRTEAGFPIARFYGYEVEGVYQSKDEFKYPDVSSLGSPKPGDLKFKDINGDGKINEKDKTTIGNPTPDLTFGWSGSISYGGFDGNIEFQGVYGNKVWRDWGNEGTSVNTYNFRKARLGRWNDPYTSNWEPRECTSSGWNTVSSSYYVEDGSYLRIRNVEIGYSIPEKFAKKMSVSSLRFYLNGQNLKTWKHNSGFTPEAGGSAIAFGIDNGGYPLPAIYSAGFSLVL